MLVLAKAFAKSLLNASILAGPTAGPLSGLFVGLFTSTVPITPSTLLADLTEASYTGYVRQALAWGTPVNGPDGAADVPATSLEWVMTADAVTPFFVHGYFLVHLIAGTVFLAGETFAQPVGFTLSGDGFTMVPNYRQTATEDLGSATVITPV